jgi:ATP phosphoribosyltransferase
MTTRLLIAMPKGRLFEPARNLLARAGVRFPGDGNGSRRLLVRDESDRYDFLSLKPVDIPVYVESGAVSAGIVGSDILREMECDVYEPVDLKIGRCRLVVAALQEEELPAHRILRVATKYPRTAERHFRSGYGHVDIIRLEGSVEIAPLLGLADAIVDLVETGRTLRENGMRIVDVIAPVSAKLIVNRTAMKIRAAELNDLISLLDAVAYENI